MKLMDTFGFEFGIGDTVVMSTNSGVRIGEVLAIKESTNYYGTTTQSVTLKLDRHPDIYASRKTYDYDKRNFLRLKQ